MLLHLLRKLSDELHVALWEEEVVVGIGSSAGGGGGIGGGGSVVAGQTQNQGH